MKQQFKTIEKINEDIKNNPYHYWAKKFATCICIPNESKSNGIRGTICGSVGALLGNNYAIDKVDEGCTVCPECADYVLRQAPIDTLRQYLDDGFMTSEKATIINALLDIKSGSTRELMSMCLTEDECNKIDTAYPSDYARRIREVLPNWRGNYNVFDYRDEKIFGTMTNVAEMFTDLIVKTFTR